MKFQNNKKHQVKISTLETSKKRHSYSTISKVTILLFFSFFIGLSVINNYLFLTEILIATSIICMLLSVKKASN